MADNEFFDPSNEFDDVEDGTSMAVVSTIDQYPLAVTEIDDNRIPEDMVCMGSFIGDRLIARSAVPPELLEDVVARSAFDSPVRLVLAAVEQDPGLQCRLFALLPAEHFKDPPADEPDEPWKASVPQFEDQFEDADETAGSGDEEGEAVVPLLLGHVVRFGKDRKFPDDLAREAADVLQTILSSETPMANVVDKVLEDLLNNPLGYEPPDESTTDEESP